MTQSQRSRRPTFASTRSHVFDAYLATPVLAGGADDRCGVGGRLRPSRGATLGLVIACLSSAGCVAGGAAPTMTPDSFAARLEPAPPADGPRLVAAHVLHDAPPPTFPAPGGDEVQLVFSHALDPTSVTADGFLVLGADGRRGIPARAVFAPADEADEGRALVLRGDFGEGAPTDVRVLGHVRTKDGRSLRGAVATVWALWEPPRLVMAYRVVPKEGRCGGARAAIRTWWSQPIVGPLADSQVRRFSLRRSDGATFSPHLAEDQTRAPLPRSEPSTEGATEGESATPDDAVLDLCFDEGAVGGTLEIPGGIVVGSSGRAAEAQTLPLLEGGAGEGE